MIVDDTPANLRLLADMLAKRGYKVRPVRDGKMALASAHALLPDLILLDINMPGMNGYQVCRILKSDEITNDIPIIFISALDEVWDKVKAFQVGGVDYITKPFQLEEVIVRVENQLTIRNLQKQLEKRLIEIQDDLDLAHDIQQSLLPPARPNWPELEALFYSQPAREVGGDFYSYYRFPDQVEEDKTSRKFAIAVGDVSGKGVSAALLMASCLSQLDASFAQSFTPVERLLYLDEAFTPYTLPRLQNCALCYLEIILPIKPSPDRTFEGVLRWVNAASIPPYLKRKTGEMEYLELSGFPLGQGLEGEYQEKSITLAKGDLIILTSDGMIEARNIAEQFFGFDRLEQAIASGPTCDAPAMLAHLKKEVASFMGNVELHDDVTLVVIKI